MKRTKHRRRYLTGRVITKRKREAGRKGASDLPNGMLEVRGHYRHMSKAARHKVSRVKRHHRKQRRRTEDAEVRTLRAEYEQP